MCPEPSKTERVTSTPDLSSGAKRISQNQAHRLEQNFQAYRGDILEPLETESRSCLADKLRCSADEREVTTTEAEGQVG